MRLPGIEPGSSAWEAPMITITLQALRIYSRRGSNPRPPAHKTGALPLSYRSSFTSQEGLEPSIFGSGNRRLIHLATGTNDTSSGTRTHNLTLRRGAPYPLGHGGGYSVARNIEMRNKFPRYINKKIILPEVGFEPTRTIAQQILSLPP